MKENTVKIQIKDLGSKSRTRKLTEMRPMNVMQ